MKRRTDSPHHPHFGSSLVCIVASFLLVAASGCATASSAPGKAGLHVERLGAGDTTVVFLPGLTGSTRYWYGPDLDAIAATNRVLLIDELGFGRSPQPAVQYTLEDHLAAIRGALVHEQATSRVVLVAHSFGTILAAHYAARYPSEVDRLYLLGTPAFDDAAEARDHLASMGGLTAVYETNRWLARLVCGIHQLMRPLASRVAPRLDRSVPAGVASDAALHDWRSLDGSIRNVILTKPIEIPLRTLPCKVTFLHGRADHIATLTRIHELATRIDADVIETDNTHRDYAKTALGIVGARIATISIPRCASE